MTISVYKRPRLPIFGQDRARAILLNASPELPIFGNSRTRAMSMYLSPQLPRFVQDRGRTIRAESPILLLSAAPAQAEKKRRKLLPGEANGFTEEMRFVAMRLHTKPKEPQPDPQQPQGAWEASLKGYLSFLVDSKLVHDKLDAILLMSPHPSYAEFRNTGLERSEKLSKDLEWFVQQGSVIPGPSSSGRRYSQYLEELAGKDPPSFICHFYNIHFAHITGGQNIGRQVAKKILDGRELEFYKWDGDLPKMLKNVKEKLNKVAEGWSRQEKNHCLKEAEKSFKYSEKIVWLIIK